MSRRMRIAAGAGVTLAVAGLLTLGGALGAQGDDPAPLRDTLGVLAQAQVAGDRLPAAVPLALHGQGGLVAATARSVGSADGIRYWTALDLRGQVCVVAVSAGGGYTASSCVPATVFAAGGVALRVDDAVHGTGWQAVLVPDGSLPASTKLGGWRSASANLVVAGPDVVAPLTLTVPGSGTVELTAIPAG
ncbi:MAG: hypothetical protein ABI566_14145 [Pseudolysinimonas sp.]